VRSSSADEDEGRTGRHGNRAEFEPEFEPESGSEFESEFDSDLES
jgi:hypothetical protein